MDDTSKFYCIVCNELKPNIEAKTILQTGYRILNDVHYHLGVCKLHTSENKPKLD